MSDDESPPAAPAPADDPRPELVELRARLVLTTDAGRPDAVERRRKTGQRTARENIADLADPGSFVEYGGLAVAAQRQRYPMDELVKISPADGILCGIGTVNAATPSATTARARWCSPTTTPSSPARRAG